MFSLLAKQKVDYMKCTVFTIIVQSRSCGYMLLIDQLL